MKSIFWCLFRLPCLVIVRVVAFPIMKLGRLLVAYVPRPAMDRRDLYARFAFDAANRNRRMASFAF